MVRAGGGSLVLKSAWSYPEPEQCGIVADETTAFSWIVAFGSSGNLLFSHADTDFFYAVTPAEPGVYWGSSVVDFSTDRFYSRMTLTTSGALAREDHPLPGAFISVQNFVQP